MRRSVAPLIMTASLGALWGVPALAYIGPGAGITLLGALWGVVIAIALAIGAVVLWPFRLLFRRRRKHAAASTDETAAKTREAETTKAGDVGTFPPRRPAQRRAGS